MSHLPVKRSEGLVLFLPANPAGLGLQISVGVEVMPVGISGTTALSDVDVMRVLRAITEAVTEAVSPFEGTLTAVEYRR